MQDKNLYSKKYKEDNKEKIKQQRSHKVVCECGFVGGHSHIRRHKRNAIHKKRMSMTVGERLIFDNPLPPKPKPPPKPKKILNSFFG